MAFFIPWLVDAARTATAGTGKSVIAVSGWESRGHGGMRSVEVVVGHHTATPESAPGDYPSQNVVINGRAGLAGPLANFGLGRSGNVYVIAAGVAFHAGASAYAGFVDLNDEAIGIEAEDSGDGVWTPDQLVMYPRLVAACLLYMRRGVDRYASHRTVAVPAGRKVDPTGISDEWMRQRAALPLENPVDPVEWDKKYTFGRTGLTTEYGNFIGETNFAANYAANGTDAIQESVTALTADLAKVTARLDQIATGDVDYATLAKAVADEIDRRFRDGDPRTGPVS